MDHIAGEPADNAAARRLLAADMYQVGRVLSRKYRSLRFSYGFLALGTMIAVILYCYRIMAG